MNRVLFFLWLMVAVIACNESNQENKTTGTDSATHTDHRVETNTIVDTAGMAGKTMMTVMESMMNNMKSIQSTDNPDNDFAALMKAHHMSAIEMAQLEIAKGTDPQVKQMAQKMIDDQQKEVAELNTFLSSHSAHGGGDAFFKEATAAMDKMNMNMDHSSSMDKQFVQMMIPHHQSAVDMARAYIKNGAHEEKLKSMANNIISSQQREISELKAWLDKNK